MSFDRRWGGAAVVVLALGCNNTQETKLPPPPPCMGNNCGGPSGGGAGQTGSGGATGTGTGPSMAIDVSGIVTRITSPDFLSGIPFTGNATIAGPGPGGTVVTASYGASGAGGAGGGGTTFTLHGVDSGPDWIEVQDDSSGQNGILSTFSPHDLSALAMVNLPVIDFDDLNNIALTLPSGATTGVVSGASQVILLVTDMMGNALPGVSVSTDTLSPSSVAYDVGPGAYDDTATKTGSGGTIILFNAGLSGNATLSLSYTSPATMMPATGSVTVFGSPSAATIIAVPLD
jgi:hypothetical protein